MYGNIYYNVTDEQISADHGVTQGRHSSCNIFSFYISDMKESVRNLDIPDFTEPNHLLQLADDTLIMSEYEQSLALIFKKIFNYCERKYIVINMDKIYAP